MDGAGPKLPDWAGNAHRPSAPGLNSLTRVGGGPGSAPPVEGIPLGRGPLRAGVGAPITAAQAAARAPFRLSLQRVTVTHGWCSNEVAGAADHPLPRRRLLSGGPGSTVGGEIGDAGCAGVREPVSVPSVPWAASPNSAAAGDGARPPGGGPGRRAWVDPVSRLPRPCVYVVVTVGASTRGASGEHRRGPGAQTCSVDHGSHVLCHVRLVGRPGPWVPFPRRLEGPGRHRGRVPPVGPPEDGRRARSAPTRAVGRSLSRWPSVRERPCVRRDTRRRRRRPGRRDVSTRLTSRMSPPHQALSRARPEPPPWHHPPMA